MTIIDDEDQLPPQYSVQPDDGGTSDDEGMNARRSPLKRSMTQRSCDPWTTMYR